MNEELRSKVFDFADDCDLPIPHVLAFLEVETDGEGFDPKTKRAIVRYEGHYFYERIQDFAKSSLQAAIASGLAHAKVGGVKNPKMQAARWALLERAKEFCRRISIPEAVALECVSVGVGQVMVSHWRKLGYASAEDMIAAADSGYDGQLDMIGRYLRAFDLCDDLREGKWQAFARGWNGPQYRRNRYDEKLAAAAAMHSGETNALDADQWPTIRVGSTNLPMVKHAQEELTRTGYFTGEIDGVFGPATRAAVLAMQADNRLTTDGVLGPQSWKALRSGGPRPLSPRREKATEVTLRMKGSRTVAAADNAEVVAGLATVAGGVGGVANVVKDVNAVAADSQSILRGFIEIFSAIGPLGAVCMIAGGATIIVLARRIRAYRVEDHRTGRNMGR